MPDPPICGDGHLDPGEECDIGADSATCDRDCTAAFCGDGFINLSADEQCDDAGESATCNADCTVVFCGDGLINLSADEQCDDGSAICEEECNLVCPGDSESLLWLQQLEQELASLQADRAAASKDLDFKREAKKFQEDVITAREKAVKDLQKKAAPIRRVIKNLGWTIRIEKDDIVRAVLELRKMFLENRVFEIDENINFMQHLIDNFWTNLLDQTKDDIMDLRERIKDLDEKILEKKKEIAEHEPFCLE